MRELGGVITRDEIIVGVLGVFDDLVRGQLEASVARIERMRGNRSALQKEVAEVSQGLQVNTVMNYTRFPIGVLRSPILGWATAERRRDLYGANTVAYCLTADGAAVVGRLDQIRDVREAELTGYDDSERASFANLTFYALVERCGFATEADMQAEINAAKQGSQRILSTLRVTDRHAIHYMPLQQAEHRILRLANEVDT
jgi:hypothetical protein